MKHDELRGEILFSLLRAKKWANNFYAEADSLTLSRLGFQHGSVCLRRRRKGKKLGHHYVTLASSFVNQVHSERFICTLDGFRGMAKGGKRDISCLVFQEQANDFIRYYFSLQKIVLILSRAAPLLHLVSHGYGDHAHKDYH